MIVMTKNISDFIITLKYIAFGSLHQIFQVFVERSHKYLESNFKLSELEALFRLVVVFIVVFLNFHTTNKQICYVK